MRSRLRRMVPPVNRDTPLNRMLDEMAKDLPEIAERAARGG